MEHGGDRDGLHEELAEDAGHRWRPAEDGGAAPFAVLQCPPLPATDDARLSQHRAVLGVAANLLGVGVLAMPRAMAQAGLLTGLAVALAMAAVMKETLQMLLVAAEAESCSGRLSYPELAKSALGPQGLAATLLAILLYSSGLLAAQLAALADTLTQLWLAVSGLHPSEVSRGQAVAVAVVLCLPGVALRAPRRWQLQGFACVAGVVLALLLLLLICFADLAAAGDDGAAAADGASLLCGGPLGLLSAAALLASQFCLHAGALDVLPPPPGRVGELDDGPDLGAPAHGAELALSGGFRRAAPLATLVGAVGYLRFGGSVQGNVFASFAAPRDADGWRWPALLVARAALAVVLVVSFGCTSVPCRAAALEVFAARRTAGGAASRKEYRALAAVLALCALAAWLVEDVSWLLGFLGAWAAGPLGLVLPALVSMEHHRRSEGRPALSVSNLRETCCLALSALLILGSIGSFLEFAFRHPAGSRGHRAVVTDLHGLRKR